jgi:hypothetical protein
MLGSFDRQEDAVFHRFERSCMAIGLLHRALGLSVTPKVRALEFDLPKTFRFYGGRIAHLDESPGERVHNVLNQLERLHTNTKGWAQKRDACEHDLLRLKVTEVKELRASIIADHTRSQSAETVAKKSRREEERVTTAAEYIDKLDSLLNCVFATYGHLVVD